MDMTSTGAPPPRSAVAAEVRAAIARANLHQTDVADAAGIPRTTFRRRLSGASPFTVDELVATANALDVPVGDFLNPLISQAA